MTDGGVGLSGEQIAWLTVSREIEDILTRGFDGKIILHCTAGVVRLYDVNETRKPGEDPRILERPTAGSPNGENRRQKG